MKKGVAAPAHFETEEMGTVFFDVVPPDVLNDLIVSVALWFCGPFDVFFQPLIIIRCVFSFPGLCAAASLEDFELLENLCGLKLFVVPKNMMKVGEYTASNFSVSWWLLLPR